MSPIRDRPLATSLTDTVRLRVARALLGLGLATGVVLSFRLWTTQRAFPLLPRIPFVPGFPYPLDWLALAVFVCLALAVAIRTRPRLETAALVLLAAILIAQDQTRCQPWVYQYVLMLFAVIPSKLESESESSRALNTLRILVAALYFWSGLQKVNLVFFTDTGPWFFEAIGKYLPISPSVAGVLSYFLPVVESSIGVGLLFPRTRRAALAAGVAMHLFILFAIGPLGHDVNDVIWPWNIVMIGILWVLFGRTERRVVRLHWLAPPKLVPRSVLVGFCLLPALNWVHLWDSYPSWALYSGMIVEGTVYIDDIAARCLDPDVRSHLRPFGSVQALSIWDWAEDVLNAPVYPERWVFRRLTDYLCTCDPEGQHIVFNVWAPGRWKVPVPAEEYQCGPT